MARPKPAPQHLRDRIRADVDAHGVRRTARRLDLSDTTIARVAGGLPVQSATIDAIERRLASADGAE
ncbi:MAG: hypothetical protein KC776_12305 [Myxococcales bacterium]|nr:hypothetical protein [Myxococcales bacterium]MCB9580990.1 hypothetical protein [Polyangiaceae bacterium]